MKIFLHTHTLKILKNKPLRPYLSPKPSLFRVVFEIQSTSTVTPSDQLNTLDNHRTLSLYFTRQLFG